MHEDEETRFALEGPEYFELREHKRPGEEWICVHVTDGDLLAVPAGIYWFTSNQENRVKAMLLP